MIKAMLESFGDVYGCKPTPLEGSRINQAAIDKLTEKYASDEWRLGKSIDFTCEMDERYEWGSVTLQFVVSEGKVSQCEVYSDAMDAEFIPVIRQCLEGSEFKSDAMRERLLKLAPSDALRREMTTDISNLIRESMAQVIMGADVAAVLREEIAKDLADLNGYVPRIAVVRVGEREDDIAYEKGVISRTGKLGLRCTTHQFPADISNEDFQQEFKKINDDSDVDGILLFRPLPKQIDEKAIGLMIDVNKDVDCML